MAANAFDAVVLAIPPVDSLPFTGTVQVNPSISFALSIGDKVQTLSTTNVRNGDAIRGLLYVPELDSKDPCQQTTASYIPANVTRLSDLHGTRNFIAIAPWVSSACTISFLAVQSRNPPEAAVFYLPDASTTTPPPDNHPVWDLGDDGAWKNMSFYPVYAIPGLYGATIMHALSEYSGNLTDAPFADDLLRTLRGDELIRVSSKIALKSPSDDLPSLWIFLLAVVAILICVAILLSLGMRLIQTRQLRSLERRVAAGEVDLETLGIKRLNVPQDILDKMPLYICDGSGRIENFIPPTAETTLEPEGHSKLPLDKKSFLQAMSNWVWISRVSQTLFPRKSPSSAPPPPSPRSQTTTSDSNQQRHAQPTFSQTTCPICLDDYDWGETTVRELPCQHIFHPECIDNFLLQNSSLCPVCKKSVLPRGYCPTKITRAMVRQERLARRIRPVQAQTAENGNAGYHTTEPTALGNGNQLLPLEAATEPRVSSLRNSIVDVLRQTRTSTHVTVPPPTRDRFSRERQEEMRRRAMAMLGDRPMIADEERAQDASRSKLLKLLHLLFPAIR
ncbi:RING finger domain-containing protein [Histoplasma ohiense]|nr:RING finger domain-containing protein [Histoplasma ohiense (nom. inval.)]